MKHIITLVNNNNDYALKKNNQLLICPYKNRVLIPAQTLAGTTLNITDMVCSSNCPFFNISEDKKTVDLACNNFTLIVSTEDIIQPN